MSLPTRSLILFVKSMTMSKKAHDTTARYGWCSNYRTQESARTIPVVPRFLGKLAFSSLFISFLFDRCVPFVWLGFASHFSKDLFLPFCKGMLPILLLLLLSSVLSLHGWSIPSWQVANLPNLTEPNLGPNHFVVFLNEVLRCFLYSQVPNNIWMSSMSLVGDSQT